MKLHLLGVTGPFPGSGGATSGYLREAPDTLLQFDMGSGVLSRLTALTAPESLTALFLSHWHFDHAADVPVLMYRLEAMSRVLPVYAPDDPDSALFRTVSSAACFDLKVVKPGDRLTLSDVRITVTAARHPVPAVGFRIFCGGRISAIPVIRTRCPRSSKTIGAAACSWRTGFSRLPRGRKGNPIFPRNWQPAWRKKPESGSWSSLT